MDYTFFFNDFFRIGIGNGYKIPAGFRIIFN